MSIDFSSEEAPVEQSLSYDDLLHRRRQITGEIPFEVPAGAPQPRSMTIFRLAYLEDLARSTLLDDARRKELALPEPVAPLPTALVITTAHFVITYDTTGSKAVSTVIAQDVANALEGALANFAKYFNVSVTSVTQVHFDAPPGPHYTDPTTGIHFNADGFRTRANNKPSRDEIAVHECFHVWQFFVGWGVTRDPERLNWMLEGTAAWAAMKWTMATPALSSPSYLTYWFEHPLQVIVATQRPTATIGYVALPFWMWVEGKYPTAIRTFLRQLPSSGTLVVDALAHAMDPAKTFEALVCECGGNIVQGNWNPMYPAITDTEQPITRPLLIPVWVGDRSADYLQQLLVQGSTWEASDFFKSGVVYFYHAQYRLQNQDPSKTWVAELDVKSLAGDGSIAAYYVVIQFPGTSPDVAQGQCTVPTTRVFHNPSEADVYFITCGNQHPPTKSFQGAFTARFQAQ